MKIVIAGAGGLLGKEFARYFSDRHEVLALTHSELDVANPQAVSRLITAERPALIVNCAVLGVDACELESSRAWAVNVLGTEHLATAAAHINSEFVHISSNYVFDGTRARNSYYTIKDTPQPTSIYGQTKLEGERRAVSACDRTFVIRTSWLFGDGKKSFVCRVVNDLKAANPVRAVTDVWASSTYVADLVARVGEIIRRKHYATYHVVNGGMCSYYEFSLEAARRLEISDGEISNLIEPVAEHEIPWFAPRPRYTPMRCIVSEELGLAPMRDWRVALAAHIQSLC